MLRLVQILIPSEGRGFSHAEQQPNNIVILRSATEAMPRKRDEEPAVSSEPPQLQIFREALGRATPSRHSG
jgi:hypothetical protein